MEQKRIPQRTRFGDSGLILARLIGDKIMIGDDIVITVTNIDRVRNEVQLGIEAPRNIPVVRKELLNRISKDDI